MKTKYKIDGSEREMTLNEAFLKALSLSEGRSNDVEIQEDDLKKYLDVHPEFIDYIQEDYKYKVLKGWSYEVSDYQKITGSFNELNFKYGEETINGITTVYGLDIDGNRSMNPMHWLMFDKDGKLI